MGTDHHEDVDEEVPSHGDVEVREVTVGHVRDEGRGGTAVHHAVRSGGLEAEADELVEEGSEDFYRAGVMVGYDIHTREVEPVTPKEQITLRDILEKDVDESYYKTDVAKWQYMKGSKSELRTRKDRGTYPYTEGAIPFPDILDRPGRTMLTSEGTVNRSSHIIEDPQTGRYRILTPIGCERLNGFPDNWTNTGMSQRQFTMGNALVVPLIEMMESTLSTIDDM